MHTPYPINGRAHSSRLQVPTIDASVAPRVTEKSAFRALSREIQSAFDDERQLGCLRKIRLQVLMLLPRELREDAVAGLQALLEPRAITLRDHAGEPTGWNNGLIGVDEWLDEAVLESVGGLSKQVERRIIETYVRLWIREQEIRTGRTLEAPARDVFISEMLETFPSARDVGRLESQLESTFSTTLRPGVGRQSDLTTQINDRLNAQEGRVRLPGENDHGGSTYHRFLNRVSPDEIDAETCARGVRYAFYDLVDVFSRREVPPFLVRGSFDEIEEGPRSKGQHPSARAQGLEDNNGGRVGGLERERRWEGEASLESLEGEGSALPAVRRAADAFEEEWGALNGGDGSERDEGSERDHVRLQDAVDRWDRVPEGVVDATGEVEVVEEEGEPFDSAQDPEGSEGVERSEGGDEREEGEIFDVEAFEAGVRLLLSEVIDKQRTGNQRCLKNAEKALLQLVSPDTRAQGLKELLILLAHRKKGIRARGKKSEEGSDVSQTSEAQLAVLDAFQSVLEKALPSDEALPDELMRALRRLQAVVLERRMQLQYPRNAEGPVRRKTRVPRLLTHPHTLTDIQAMEVLHERTIQECVLKCWKRDKVEQVLRTRLGYGDEQVAAALYEVETRVGRYFRAQMSKVVSYKKAPQIEGLEDFAPMSWYRRSVVIREHQESDKIRRNVARQYLLVLSTLPDLRSNVVPFWSEERRRELEPGSRALFKAVGIPFGSVTALQKVARQYTTTEQGQKKINFGQIGHSEQDGSRQHFMRAYQQVLAMYGTALRDCVDRDLYDELSAFCSNYGFDLYTVVQHLREEG